MPGLAAGVASCPTGPQIPGQLALQRAAGLHIQRLIDRLGRHPHLRLLGERRRNRPAICSGEKRWVLQFFAWVALWARSDAYAVVEVNDAVPKPALIEKFELCVDVVWHGALAASHHDRA